MTLATIDALCQTAREAIAQRDWDKARQAYMQALALKSNSADIHQGLATVCFQMHDLPAAANHFKEVTRLEPHRAGAFINLGAIYNLLDKLDDALNVLRKGIGLDPQKSEGYYNLGLVYRRKGQSDLAVHAYKEALRHNPRMADAHYNLGNLHLDKEQYRQAVDCYRKALEARPGWDKAVLGLEKAREALSVQEEAAQGVEQEEPVAAPPPVVRVDPRKTVHPEANGPALTALHKATIEAEALGRVFLEMAGDELEPAIKDLSAALVSSGVSAATLTDCVEQFEKAMGRMRRLKAGLAESIARVRLLGDQLVNEAS
jgi:tetratricopeptide (TPR) repeat protein